MSNSLVFQNTTFSIVDRNGQPWLRGLQIGGALGYAKPDNAIWKLYETHKDEFTDSMTALVKLPDLNPQTGGAGQMREVRIFSLRGAYALAMFARTAIAKQFRVWLLDLAERETQTVSPAMQSDLQAIVSTISPDGKQKAMVWSRFNRHFKIAKYSQLPCSQIEEAKRYLIETFLEGEYIEQDELDAQSQAEKSVSLYDIKEKLRVNLSAPTVPLSDLLKKLSKAKSFEIASELQAALQENIERQISYRCESGMPRRIDEQQAIALIESTTLDSALSHHYRGLITNVQIMASHLKKMTEAYCSDIGRELDTKPLHLVAA